MQYDTCKENKMNDQLPALLEYNTTLYVGGLVTVGVSVHSSLWGWKRQGCTTHFQPPAAHIVPASCCGAEGKEIRVFELFGCSRPKRSSILIFSSTVIDKYVARSLMRLSMMP